MKTDKAIWKPPLSKRTPPLSTNLLFLSNFFMRPLFIQISKARNPPTFMGGEGEEGGGEETMLHILKICYYKVDDSFVSN